jgi:GntR family transcriptional repressor for pyruvate dehydrogenase complex
MVNDNHMTNTSIPNAGRRRGGRNNHRDRPRKTAVLIAQRIVSEIVDNDLQPGSPLLSERAMLEHYGVARGTLRESLRLLELQGILQIKTGPGGGPFVAEPASRDLAGVLAMMLQLRRSSFREVLEARHALEPLLAAQAAERISDEALAALAESVESITANVSDIDLYLEENENFHSIIAEAAGNQVFFLIISSLAWICDGTAMGVEFPLKARKIVCEEHRRIYEAIAARDPKRSADAMEHHVMDFERFLKKKYPAVLNTMLRWDQLD